jgi:hypothetical protein
LIALDSPDYADPEGLIRLYPSIPLSMDRNALDEAAAFLRSKENGGNEEGQAEFSAEDEP